MAIIAGKWYVYTWLPRNISRWRSCHISIVDLLKVEFNMLFVLWIVAAEVTLASSVEQDGRTAACPGELVTFTCTVTQGVSLNWASTAFTSCDFTPTYLLAPGTSVGSNSICGSFQANLTDITNITQVGRSLQADITSTLSPTTTVSPGTVVTCSDLLISQGSPQSKSYPNFASKWPYELNFECWIL